MAISKVILNGDTLMDVTSDTVEEGKLLSNETATKNDGTKVTGNIASKSSTDLIVSGATVTAPAGYYANAASKAVTNGSAFPPAVTITKAPTFSMNSSTGVITASYTGSSSITPTVNAGYISQGTAGTISTTGSSTYTLTTQGAQTITPGSAAQTIASNRWLTGTQTIAGDSNLKAENIAEGVSIFGVTGTHSGKAKHTATITAKGIYDTRGGIYCFVYVTVGQRHYTLGDTFEFSEGDTLKCCLAQYDHRSQVVIYVNGDVIYSDSGSSSASSYSYDYILPDYDIDIALTTTGASMSITTPTISITENGNYDVADYGYANVDVKPKYYATITSGDGSGHVYAKYPGSSGTIYYNTNDKFEITEGSIIYLSAIGSRVGGAIYINGTLVAHSQDDYATYSYTVPSNTDVEISLSYGGNGTIRLTEVVASLDISENGTYNVSEYDFADVNVSAKEGFTVDQIAMRSISGDISGNASIIDSYAFYHCSLTTVNFPSCTTISNYAFNSCFNLTTANFPSCTTIGNSAFYSCTSLTTASFPSCTKIKNQAFYGCTSLTAASFPSCTMIGNYTFAYCFNLTTVSFPSCTTIGSATFYRCFNLLSIYLLGSSITSITSNTFDSTPIAGYTTSTGGVYGSIFVPASLYDSYLTAANWSRYSSRFVSV